MLRDDGKMSDRTHQITEGQGNKRGNRKVACGGGGGGDICARDFS